MSLDSAAIIAHQTEIGGTFLRGIACIAIWIVLGWLLLSRRSPLSNKEQ